jgi:ATP-dependent DNA helicase RecG
MYQLHHSLDKVKGIGSSWTKALAKKNIHSILDFLLYLPLRYEDRSQIYSIAQLKKIDNSIIIDQEQLSKQENKKDQYQSKQEFFTTKVSVKDYRQYYKGRLLIGRATLVDETGELSAIWFNNKFLKNKLEDNQLYYASGELKKGSLVQANLESIGEDSPHIARLVPIYSQINPFKQGSLRRLQKEIIDHLNPQQTLFTEEKKNIVSQSLSFKKTQNFFQALHFPETSKDIIAAREQLALEEIIFLINKAKQLKENWQQINQAPAIKIKSSSLIPNNLPFTLTKAQEKALKEISQDLSKTTAMNRLLIGDVGSGKTIVAGIVAWHTCLAGHNVALVAPTQILAQQHLQNLQKIFPQQKIHLLTAQNSSQFQLDDNSLYIGTHALINKLEKIRPALIIYDEQHRFGVRQRQNNQAHLLSMTATPIPRSLMLTIFAHLQTSVLDEMPANRQIAKTWLVPTKKEQDAIIWLTEQLLKSQDKQAFIVCPFINPSSHSALENVAAVKATHEQFKAILDKYYQEKKIDKRQQLRLAVLHSRLKKQAQQTVIEKLYEKKIQMLISTPMIEVGIDLPNADFILIQAAERFGLASLHQLRGRVGRIGQESFCLLFTSHTNTDRGEKSFNANFSQRSQERLKIFCQEKDGFKLAQLDLKQRGAGDIFGTMQSGFNKLKFASWTNLNIIKEAQKITEKNNHYQSALHPYFEKQDFLSEINDN